MTSVSPRGPSPHSPYDLDSSAETDQSWDYVGYSSDGSGPGSISFYQHSASGSLSGYALVGSFPSHATATTTAAASHHVSAPLLHADMAPMFHDMEAPMFSSAEYVNAASDFTVHNNGSDFGTLSAPFNPGLAPVSRADALFNPNGFYYAGQEMNDMPDALLESFMSDMVFPSIEPSPNHHLQNQQAFQPMHAEPVDIPPQQFVLNTMQMYQTSPSPATWAMPSHQASSQSVMVPSDTSSKSFSPAYTSSSTSADNSASTSPLLNADRKMNPAFQIRKVKAGKVDKKKKAAATAASSSVDKFLILTLESTFAAYGRMDPGECSEAMRATQRGRKGPLAEETEESALQVRRVGACFCCKIRKVKCDELRPCAKCKNLTKLTPQIMCWRFPDFLPVLFPDFMRQHLREDQMSQFIKENLAGMTVSKHQTYQIELYSGTASVMKVSAKVFRAKAQDIHRHYQMLQGPDGTGLVAGQSVPLVLELNTPSQKDALRRKANGFVRAMMSEPKYAQKMITTTPGQTTIPRRILEIVRTYANQTKCPLVTKALAIYSADFVMGAHLCLTKQSVERLHMDKLIPRNSANMTSRVLGRQIKAALDEQMLKDMNDIFKEFGKRLKPKQKDPWASCLAAFLVLCLFFEGVENAAVEFVYASNYVDSCEGKRQEFKPEIALEAQREVEQMPFMQFAYQFHHLYQTHSKDVSAKPYNPLRDEPWMEGFEGADAKPAINMVHMLRGMIQPGSTDKATLEYLAEQPLLPDNGILGSTNSLVGRLAARFILSFTDEKYIFGGARRRV